MHRCRILSPTIMTPHKSIRNIISNALRYNSTTSTNTNPSTTEVSETNTNININTSSNSNNNIKSNSTNVGNAMRTSGFEFSTPNFSLDGAADLDAADLAKDLITTPVTQLNFIKDMYGPWLVLTEELQGELFIDHDYMIYLRPANGLGFGVGRINIKEKKSPTTDVSFTLTLESYIYPATTTMPPYAPINIEVTGLVKRVQSTGGEYETFSLLATWSKKDGTSGRFNAAKLTPWDPASGAKPWEPKEELQHIFKQVFPTELKLTSHLKRSQAAREVVENNNNNNNVNSNGISGPYHLSLDPYRVGDVSDVHYIPNYISEEEEQQILEIVKNTPAELKNQLTKRTAQEWGCTMCEECNKSFVSDRNMPQWVEACNDMLLHDGIFTPSTFPNSVRVHEYKSSEGIAPHCDGPIYYPLIAVISLGSPCVMYFYPRREPHDQPMEHYNDTFRFNSGIAMETPMQSVVLEPRSLMLFRGDVFYYYPHGTSDRAVDILTPELAGNVINRHLLKDKNMMEVHKGYRVSITVRNLLPRCNHQPTRAEYNMKRAWYLYNQLSVPEPLITPAPLVGLPTQTKIKENTTSTKSSLLSTPTTTGSLNNINLIELEKKVDELLIKQNVITQQVADMQNLMAAEATFRSEVSTVLGHLSSTVLEMDSKLDDILQKSNNEEEEEEEGKSIKKIGNNK